MTLLRTGSPPELVREAAKRPAATLKELQKFQTSPGFSLRVTTIS